MTLLCQKVGIFISDGFSYSSDLPILDIISIYQWLVCYLLKITYNKYENNIKKGMDPFTAKNDIQVFYSRSLGIAYIQVKQKFIYTLCSTMIE